jgi:hypothetical protein
MQSSPRPSGIQDTTRFRRYKIQVKRCKIPDQDRGIQPVNCLSPVLRCTKQKRETAINCFPFLIITSVGRAMPDKLRWIFSDFCILRNPMESGFFPIVIHDFSCKAQSVGVPQAVGQQPDDDCLNNMEWSEYSAFDAVHPFLRPSHLEPVHSGAGNSRRRSASVP